MGVEQSGNVTPGHVAKFIGNGVIADGGAPVSAQRVLGKLTNANFDDTNDQPIIIAATVFQLTGLIITNTSISLQTAVGGFYPEAFKAGSPIVAAAQVYSSLTDPDLLLQATLTAFAQTARFSSANLPDGRIYLSLTTGEPLPTTADVYAIGIDLSV